MKIPRLTPSHISVFFATVFILTLVSPYLNSTGHGMRNSWVVFSLWLLSTFFWKRGALNKTVIEIERRKYEVICLIFWLLVVILNAALERGYTWDLHFLSMMTMGMVIFMQICHSAQRDGSDEVLLLTVFAFISFEVIRSIPTLWSQPAIARIIMGVMATPEMIAQAGADSVGQYGYYTGLAIALPVIVSRAIVSGGAKAIMLWVTAAGIVFAISIATFMGAILLMVLGLLILGVYHIKYARSKIKIFAFYGAVAAIFIVAWSVLLSDMEQVSFISDKAVNQFAGISELGIKEGDVTERSGLWEMSLNTFLENPLFGVGPVTNRVNPFLWSLVGGHSSWFDQLAEYGLLGFGFYILFLGLVVVRITKSFTQEKSSRDLKICYWGQLVSCFLFILGGIYNPVVVITEVFVIFYFISSGNPAHSKGGMPSSKTVLFTSPPINHINNS